MNAPIAKAMMEAQATLLKRGKCFPWITCAHCGKPLHRDEALYPFDDETGPIDETMACHEACERDFRDA